jgi:hypothetical protein
MPMCAKSVKKSHGERGHTIHSLVLIDRLHLRQQERIMFKSGTVDLIDDMFADSIQNAILSHLKNHGALDLERDFSLVGEARAIFLNWTPDQTAAQRVERVVEMLSYLQGRGVVKPGEAIPIIERARSGLRLVAARVDDTRKENEMLDRIFNGITDKLAQLDAQLPRNVFLGACIARQRVWL